MQRGIECLNSCVYNWLKKDNVSLKMSDIYFLGNGFKMHYTGNYGNHMIYTEQYESNRRFIKKYTDRSVWGKCREETFIDKTRFIKNMLQKYNRIIIRVSCAELPYNKKFLKGTIISHYILVTGYENGKFSICDACSPTYGEAGYEGNINEKELIDNWELMDCEYIILKYEKKIFESDKLKKKIVRKRKQQIKSYLKEPLNSFEKKYSGYRCIISLLEDMKEIFKYDISEIKNIIAECNKQLRIEGFQQSKMFICDAVELEYKEEYKYIVEKWDKLILKLLKSGVKNDSNLYKTIYEEAVELIEKENELLNEIF